MRKKHPRAKLAANSQVSKTPLKHDDAKAHRKPNWCAADRPAAPSRRSRRACTPPRSHSPKRIGLALKCAPAGLRLGAPCPVGSGGGGGDPEPSPTLRTAHRHRVAATLSHSPSSPERKPQAFTLQPSQPTALHQPAPRGESHQRAFSSHGGRRALRDGRHDLSNPRCRRRDRPRDRPVGASHAGCLQRYPTPRPAQCTVHCRDP